MNLFSLSMFRGGAKILIITQCSQTIPKYKHKIQQTGIQTSGEYL